MSLAEFYEKAARHYDTDWAHVWKGEHIAFYTGLALESGGPLLEMGCGTGLVSLSIARAGIPVHAMDFSQAMLAEFRAKLEAGPAEVRERVTLTAGDVRFDRVEGAFNLIIAPGHVMQTFCERADQRAFLWNVRRHLAPDGAFVFDVFQPDYQMLAAAKGDVWRPLADNSVFRVTHDAIAQTQLIEIRWLTDAGEEFASTRHRWFTHAELENLLELEGFRVTREWGGFDGRPYGQGATEQIFRVVACD